MIYFMSMPINHIPYEKFGGTGPALHFAHANGYPPGAYRPLLEHLATNFSVLAMHMRPLWPNATPSELKSWKILADDLAHFLDQNQLSPIIGVGHSMGATTTLRLALRKPQLFSALVLIDPVFFPPRMIYFWKLIYHLGLARRLHPLVKGALRRRRIFDSTEAMFANYRRKTIFQGIDDLGLQAYVDALAKPLPDGRVGLSYSPEWEARIYLTGVGADMPLWRGLPHLKPPILILRGQNTSTFWESTARLVQRKLPSAVIETIPGVSHLLPLEEPEQVSQAILEYLNTQNQILR